MFGVKFHNPAVANPHWFYLFPREDGTSDPVAYGPVYPFKTCDEAAKATQYCPEDAESVSVVPEPKP